MEVFEREGFEFFWKLLRADEIAHLRELVDEVAESEKKVCMWNVTAKLSHISDLAESNVLKQLLTADYLSERSILSYKAD